MKLDAEIWDFWGAITQGHIATAQKYLDSGGGVDDSPSDFPFTALYRTIHMRHEVGYEEWMRFLLDVGANPNHPQGWLRYSVIAPLFLSVGHNIMGATKLLLDYGANPNLFIGGGTCLHISATNPRVEMIQLLLDYGADYSIRDDEGKQPIDNFEEVLAWKIERGNLTYSNEAKLRQMISPKPNEILGQNKSRWQKDAERMAPIYQNSLDNNRDLSDE